MKRITICIDDANLKLARKVQADVQQNEQLSVSLSNVISSCVSVAVNNNKTKIKDEISANLSRA